MDEMDRYNTLKKMMMERFKEKAQLIKELKAVIQIMITGENANSFTISIDGEDTAIHKNKADDADITISIDSEDFEKILKGELSYKSAFFNGKLIVEGDILLALKIISAMKG